MLEIKFVDLFAGIGGFRFGLEKAGEYIQRAEWRDIRSEGDQPDFESRHDKQSESWWDRKLEFTKNPYRCVYANEWDKYAALIYEKQFEERPDTRDFREVEAEDIPEHILLTAGFPCQAFSVAGKRKGFEDTRGTLFFEVARVLAEKHPSFLLLENVRGLLSHDKGKTFGIILETLDELGYDLQWQVLNSKNFGVPQNRERVFIIGNLRGRCRPEIFPISGDSETSLRELTRDLRDAERVYDSGGLARTLKGLGGGMGAKTGLYFTPETEQDIRAGIAVANNELRHKTVANALDANYWKGLDCHQQRTGILENARIRRLTPVECERLQGFPDRWTEGISDTQRYKCLGNAVTTNVVAAIGIKLALSLIRFRKISKNNLEEFRKFVLRDTRN